MSPGEGHTRGPSDWALAALAEAGTALVVTDADARVLSLNPVAEALTGRRQGGAAGQALAAVFRVLNQETRLPVESPAARVLRDGATVGSDDHALLVARDGTELPIEYTAAPIRDAGGKAAGAVLVFRDVSRRRRLERLHERALTYAAEIIATLREPFLVLDRDLRVQTANAAFYRSFRVSREETEGRFLHELGDGQWDIPSLRALLADVIPGDRPVHDFLVEHTFPALGPRAMLVNARRFPPAGENAESVLLAIEDVTARQRAAYALEVSESRYRRLFEAAQDGILIVDPGTRRVFDANPFLTDLLGYTRDELVGRELWEIGLFRDVESNKAAFRALQERGYIRYEDLPLGTKDGRQIDVEFVSNVYQVDHTSVVQCNIRDVTDRKRAEAAVREAHGRLEERVRERTAELAQANQALAAEMAARREMQRRLATAQEDERRRVARELHDQLGQYLAALGLGLKALEDAARSLPAVRDQVHLLRQLTDRIGRDVHDLALELRPTALDDLGLPAALASYLEEWAGRAGVRVEFHSAGLDRDRLPPAVETALYRVVQEALTNVLKHGRARRVSLVLQRTPDGVVATVEDDGRGFDPDAHPPDAGRLGLLGMRERVELVGGVLTVESAPGRGTTVIARVPLAPGGEGERD